MLEKTTETTAKKIAALIAASLILFSSLNSFAAIPSAAVSQNTPCTSPPPAVVNIHSNSPYLKTDNTIFDPKRKVESLKKTKPLRDYLSKIAALSDSYIADHNTDSGNCALVWLASWAKGGALLGATDNAESEYHRKWSSGGLAIIYLKVKPLADENERKTIEPWLSALANKALEFSDSVSAKASTHNNHLYFVGLSAMATGVAVGRNDLIDRARDIYDEALFSINSDGTLPLELARKSKALNYHSFALDPIILMAELSRSVGENWYDRDPEKLAKLADTVLNGIQDPRLFDNKAGAKQDATPHAGGLAWIEFYRRVSAHPEKIDPLLKQRPFFDPKLGGNVTLLAQKDFFGSLNFKTTPADAFKQ